MMFDVFSLCKLVDNIELPMESLPGQLLLLSADSNTCDELLHRLRQQSKQFFTQILSAPQALVVVFIGSSPSELNISNSRVDDQSSILVEVMVDVLCYAHGISDNLPDRKCMV